MKHIRLVNASIIEVSVGIDSTCISMQQILSAHLAVIL